MCIGFRSEDPYCDGDSHLRVFIPKARLIMNSEHPELRLHDEICVMETHGRQCQQRREHADILGRRYGLL